MRDPLEGVAADSTIVTGACRGRIPAVFEPILDAVREGVAAIDSTASAYLYGSVTTGQARPGASGVGLLTIEVDGDTARQLGNVFTVRFGTLCRGAEIGPAEVGDRMGEHDEAYGFRVFLRRSRDTL